MDKNAKLTDLMTALYNKATKGKMPVKTVIAQAVQLGIDYQTNKIKQGINIVFDTLESKNIKQ